MFTQKIVMVHWLQKRPILLQMGPIQLQRHVCIIIAMSRELLVHGQNVIKSITVQTPHLYYTNIQMVLVVLGDIENMRTKYHVH